MADVIRKQKKVSKKSKKSWRKNTDITDVEEHLEEVRRDERTGGSTATKTNESIFFVDKEITEVKQLEAAKLSVQKDNEDEEEEEEVYVSQKEKMMRQLAIQKKKEKEDKAKQAKVPIKNIWGQEVMTVRNSFLEPVYKKPKVMPSTVGLGKAPIDAVDIPHEGSSYNPDYDTHQELLGKAHEEELTKLKEREKLNKKVKMVSVAELKKQSELWLQEMSEGLNTNNNNTVVDEKESSNEESDDDDEEEDEEDDEDEEGGKTTKKTMQKTLKEKRKEKERREEERKVQEEKYEKTKLHDVHRIKKMKKEIVEAEKKSEEKQLKRRAKSERIRTKRLAKQKFEESATDVKLSEDLTPSLRELKPEGSLLQDRFKSLQKRNIIETRKPVVPKRRYKRKVYVRRSYNTDNIKDFKPKR